MGIVNEKAKGTEEVAPVEKSEEQPAEKSEEEKEEEKPVSNDDEPKTSPSVIPPAPVGRGRGKAPPAPPVRARGPAAAPIK